MNCLKTGKPFFEDLINIWESNDGCMEQYQCKTALYLPSMLAHAYDIIIDHNVRYPGHGREVVDDFNSTEKRFLSIFMTTMKILDRAVYDAHMEIHTPT